MPSRVLLVVADATLGKHLCRQIARHGLLCHLTASAADALDELAQRHYPVAVLDLDLLDSSAAAVARRLRAVRPGLHLVGLDSMAWRHGADDTSGLFHAVIPKPFLIEPLLAALSDLVGAAESQPQPAPGA